ncbi:hypothetical protein [Proteiniphilum sp.]|uniref:hypothetical protein n=1 Tax=Proteiniphilum sp. TaxID=1926877 RepID=UPI00331E3822
MPTSSLIRKHEVTWNYDLPEGKHTIQVKVKHIPENYFIHVRDAIMYSEKDPEKQIHF